MSKLPPLNSLRFFEAAARLGSFTHAARELNVSQAAVSHQIKLLEARLGLALFSRRGHHLTLTRKGTVYAHGVRAALTQITEATQGLTRRTGTKRRLALSTLPSFAAKFLLPRLPAFLAEFPSVDLRLSATEALADVAGGECDLAIRSGLGAWPGLHAELIVQETLFPVCAPHLLKDLRRPSDLRRHRLIIDEPRWRWDDWCRQAGVKHIDTEHALVFNDISLALQAAIDGQGVCLARGFLARDDLAAGRLAKPFKLEISNDYSLWLVYAENRAKDPVIAGFRNWLLGQLVDSQTAA